MKKESEEKPTKKRASKTTIKSTTSKTKPKVTSESTSTRIFATTSNDSQPDVSMYQSRVNMNKTDQNPMWSTLIAQNNGNPSHKQTIQPRFFQDITNSKSTQIHRLFQQSQIDKINPVQELHPQSVFL